MRHARAVIPLRVAPFCPLATRDAVHLEHLALGQAITPEYRIEFGKVLVVLREKRKVRGAAGEQVPLRKEGDPPRDPRGAVNEAHSRTECRTQFALYQRKVGAGQHRRAAL